MTEKNNSFGENEYVSILIALFGLITLTFYQIATETLSIDYLYIFLYTFCGIFLIRLIDLNIRRIFSKVGIAVSFSISWLTVTYLSLVLGLIGLKISMLSLGALAALCIILTGYLNLFCRLDGKKFILIIAIALTLSISMCILSAPNNMPWLSEISKAGLGYHDTFRDAAIANIWSNYGLVSHGIHGLLKEPYHALFALQYAPLLSDHRDIFTLFIGFSYIVIPALLTYGMLNIFSHFNDNIKLRNKILLVLIFLFSFSCFNYVTGQRSLQVASMILLGLIPLIYEIYVNRSKAQTAIVVLSISVPILIFARVFHGLVIASVLFTQIFFVGRKLQLTIFLSATTCFLILSQYFGKSSRSFVENPLSILDIFLIKQDWHIDPFILLLLVAFLISFNFKGEKQSKILFLPELKNLYLVVAISGLALLLIANGVSDAFYQLIPAFWIIAILMIASLRYPEAVHGPRFISQNSKRFLVIFLIVIAFDTSLYIMDRAKEKLLFHRDQVVQSYNENLKTSKEFDYQWSEEQELRVSTKLGVKELISQPRARKAFYSMVSVLDKSLPAKMSASATLLRANTNGSSAIYIPRNHPYWNYEFNSDPMRSIYFPAVAGLPILFGAIPNYRSAKFSMKAAHNAGGTLNNLDPKLDRVFLCMEAKKVDIDNVIFFQNSEIVPILIGCDL